MRIISWNTQGDSLNKLNSAYNGLLSSCNDNIIMIQEGGNVGQPNGTQFSHTFGTSSRGHKFQACFFEQPNAKIQKCTTGILVEEGFNNVNFKSYQGIGKRPIVVCECTCAHPTLGTRAFVFATVHLTASEHTAEEELQDTYISLAHQYGLNNVPWLLMGDLNCQADKLNPDIPMNISYPSNRTHQRGKKLDFAVFSDSMKLIASIDTRICSDTGGYVPLSSDHFPVYCEF